MASKLCYSNEQDEQHLSEIQITGHAGPESESSEGPQVVHSTSKSVKCYSRQMPFHFVQWVEGRDHIDEEYFSLKNPMISIYFLQLQFKIVYLKLS
jgi:hypothetical protein